MNKAEFLKFLEEQGYFSVRELPDGSFAGLYRLLYTTAVCTGLCEDGWVYRYCFDDPALAAAGLASLQEMDDEPPGFIARRGRP
jgi:hypothetical protein